MRRILLGACSVAMAFAAQAITFAWDNAATLELTRGSSGGYSASLPASVSLSGDFAIRVALTFGGQGDADWFNDHGTSKLLLNLGDANARHQFSVYQNKNYDNQITTWDSEHGSKQSGQTIRFTVENDLIFAYDSKANAMSVSLNGTTIATLGQEMIPSSWSEMGYLSFAGYEGDADGAWNETWSGISSANDW